MQLRPSLFRFSLILFTFTLAGISGESRAAERKAPAAAEAIVLAEGEMMPQPVLHGGGAMPLSAALAGEELPAKEDENGLPWVRLAGARELRKGGKIGDSHYYLVIRPTPGRKHGLLSRGWRQFDDYSTLAVAADGSLYFHSENAGGQRVAGGGLAAGKAPKPGAPFLLEIHPDGNGRMNFAVGGQPSGWMSAVANGNVFGTGYGNEPHFEGEIGEIRTFAAAALTPEQTLEVSRLIASWWMLPGGIEGAYEEGFRSAPLLLGGTFRAGESAGLAVKVTRVDEGGRVAIGASSAEGTPTTENLPAAGASAVWSRQWRVHTTAAAEGTLQFSKERMFSDAFAGQGFYALFHRNRAEETWREIATASVGAQGNITFPGVRLESGYYTLGVIGGNAPRKSAAQVMFNGKPAEGTVKIAPGTFIRLESKGHEAGQLLKITDLDSKLPLYSGPADTMALGYHALRTASQKLVFQYASAGVVLGKEATLTIALNSAEGRLYPGVLTQMVRRTEGMQPALPSAERFAVSPERGKPWTAKEYADYPNFRTGDAVITPPYEDPLARWAYPPDYFHTVIPGLAIATDPGRRVDWAAPPSYPADDLGFNGDSSVRFSGVLLIREAGEYAFALTRNFPARMVIGGKSLNLAPASGDGSDEPQLVVNLKAGAVPFEIVADRPAGAPALESVLRWKTPGSAEPTIVPAGAFAHPVSAVREKALATLTGDFPYRAKASLPGSDDAELVAAIGSFDTAPHITDAQKFIDETTKWVGAFFNGKVLAGDPRVARTAFRLMRDRAAFLRRVENKAQLDITHFGKTDGRPIAFLGTLRPFTFICERLPELQAEALDARAALAEFAISGALSRSVFAEWNDGANDGYNDPHNLIKNFWIAAENLDDPYCWDAATCLQDNHMAYVPKAGLGLTSDGSYNFHNANGRQIMMYSYGQDWFRRVVGGGAGRSRVGSPWGYTHEEYRRFAGYAKGMEWLFYRGSAPLFAGGRQNWLKRGNNAVEMAKSILNSGEAVGQQTREDLGELLKRSEENPENPITGNRFFFRNLFMTHRRADFCVHVKMIGGMSGGTETFRGMHPWDMAFSDGFTMILRHGKEFDKFHQNAANGAYAQLKYFDRKTNKIADSLKSFAGHFPTPALWNYRSLAGTTLPDDEVFHPDRYRGGAGPNAGGVSDGKNGHCAFQGNQGNLGITAAKFYAFFDDGMLQLVNGITSSRTNLPQGVTTRTNLNQTEWLTDVTIINETGEKRVLALAGSEQHIRLPMNQRYLILHDGAGYLVVPTGSEGGPGKIGTLCIDLSERTPLSPVPGVTFEPAFIKAAQERKFPDLKAKVFHLSIDHGANVKDGTAAYFVCLTGATEKAAHLVAKPPFALLSNTQDIQAVSDLRSGLTHAYFRKGGELRNTAGKLIFKTPAPASVMWTPAEKEIVVQDPQAVMHTPTEWLNEMQLTIGPGLTGIEKESPLKIMMPGNKDPDDRYRGAPVSRKIP